MSEAEASGRKKRSRIGRWLKLVALGVIGGLLLTGFGFMVLAVWEETGPAQSLVCCTTPADWGADSRPEEYRYDSSARAANTASALEPSTPGPDSTLSSCSTPSSTMAA